MLLSQTPLVSWAGKGGGVSSAGLLKSKNSVMSSACASRCVSGGTELMLSISLRIEVSSRGLWETKCGFTQGESTSAGSRNPERLNLPGKLSPGALGGESRGGMLSGGGTWKGGTWS